MIFAGGEGLFKNMQVVTPFAGRRVIIEADKKAGEPYAENIDR